MELIDRYVDQWNWDGSGFGLSSNPALPWSDELIAQYADKWLFDELSLNEGIPWHDELINQHADKWDWKQLSQNIALPWSKTLIERFANKWDWNKLSLNPSVEWDVSLLNYADKHHLPVEWANLNAETFFQSISPETLISLGRSK